MSDELPRMVLTKQAIIAAWAEHFARMINDPEYAAKVKADDAERVFVIKEVSTGA